MNLNQTTNYQLSQWESTDRILMSDFNSDNAKLDAALKAHSDAIAGKAAQSTVNSLTQTVSAKANQSDLTALTQTVSGKADASALTAETAARQTADDALAAKAGAQLIRTETLSSAAAWMSVDFRDFDWSQWHTVRVVFQPVPDSISYETYINSQASNELCGEGDGPRHVVLCPGFMPELACSGSGYPGGEIPAFSFHGIPFSGLTYLTFDAQDSPQPFQAGSQYTVWGER